MRATLIALVAGLLISTNASAQNAVQAPETFTVYSRMVDRPVSFKVDLDIPTGDGPFPAVILMHGCGGLSPSRAPHNWRRALRDMGFVTMIIESFTPRGWPTNICLKEPEIGWQGQNDRTAEAFGAARLLRTLPFVKKDAIALMGFSHGAGTVLWAGERDDGYWTSRGYGHQIERFDALIAVYPWCGTPTHRFRAQPSPIQTPLLILAGEWDSVTPKEFCEAYETLRAPMSNGNVALRIYPSAYHSFDSGQPITTASLCGGVEGKCGVRTTLGHSEPAFRQAQRDVAAFLKQRLNVSIP